MADDPKKTTLKSSILSDIAELLSSLEGAELDEFLREIGEDPDKLFQQGKCARTAARLAHSRRRLDAARELLKSRVRPNMATILSLDLGQKHALLAQIEKRAQQTGEMTLAARNRQKDSESDVDSFLEACLMLGLIDEQGNLVE